MKTFGYVLQAVHRERESPMSLGSRLCFPADDQVIVAFVTEPTTLEAEPSGLAHRGQPEEGLPYRLRALFVDTATGRVRTTRQWPTGSKWAWIARAPEGKFLVITPERLTLYAPSIEPLKHLDLPIGQEAIKDAWQVTPSPGGRYLVVDYEPRVAEERTGDAVLHRDWIDTDSLQVLRAWTLEGMSTAHDMQISDDGTALVGYKIGKPGGPWHQLCLPSPSQPYCGGSFVGNDVMLSLKLPKDGVAGMGLVNTSGDLLFQQKFLRGEIYRALATSANGGRFALALDKGKGGSAVLDIAPHYSLSRIIVYDLAAKQWVYSLDGKKQGIKSISALALSPDGSRLALINQDGILEVYRLPEAPSTASQSTQ